MVVWSNSDYFVWSNLARLIKKVAIPTTGGSANLDAEVSFYVYTRKYNCLTHECVPTSRACVQTDSCALYTKVSKWRLFLSILIMQSVTILTKTVVCCMWLTVQTQNRRHRTRRLIRVSTDCLQNIISAAKSGLNIKTLNSLLSSACLKPIIALISD